MMVLDDIIYLFLQLFLSSHILFIPSTIQIIYHCMFSDQPIIMITINYFISQLFHSRDMLAKFETKSSRVKGVSFHPTRPWILCSLHDGQIQLWDYRVGTLLETFDEHDGPVRSVDFHSTQPLFVSGGDDYKIRVWNYNNKRSLFTLMGHLDYIRTVQFHPTNPWIVSCSDDQNVRIWNWQSRECIAVLTGHNHYVMSAQFHPKDDLVVSASLDQTIRVWDISGLKQKGKTMSAKSSGPGAMIGRLGTDLVGTVKYVLEGHERGVNWAAFHPELPLIVSGSDDRLIKIWRTNEVKAWEVDTLRGHTNNISCVMFHPREDLILSNSEDHSIRVWDSTKRVSIQSFVRAHDRFWTITAHKTQNLLAAGHDSGTVVFKLRRERTPFACSGNLCLYVKDRYYHMRELDRNGRDKAVAPVTRNTNSKGPQIVLANHHETNAMLVLIYNGEAHQYEFLSFKKDLNESSTPSVQSGNCTGVAFVSRNKYAILENSDTLTLRGTDRESAKRIKLPRNDFSTLFDGGASGRVFVYNDSTLFLFDTSSQQILGSILVDGVKRVVWNASYTLCAILAASSVRILDKDLKQLSIVTEKIHVKDALWDDHDILLYSTLSQVKYMLPSGEKGIVRSLDSPVYLVAYRKDTLYAFNRDNQFISIEINPSEFLFKYYLEHKQYRNAIRIIRTCNLDSKAIISYLQRNGFEDIALYFVSEPRARFNLAIRCGNLDTAMECATSLDETSIWSQLAEEALKQGNHDIVETCYQRMKSFNKLSFLYLITGDREKLEKMMKIANLRHDYMSYFYNAMYLNDIDARINVLVEVGQLTLAYITAVVYNKEEAIEKIREMLEEQKLPVPVVEPPATLLSPPQPVNEERNWSLLEMTRNTIDRVMEEEAAEEPEVTPEQELDRDFQSIEDQDEPKENQWEDDDLDLEGGENGWEDDLDLSDDEPLPVENTEEFAIPKPGSSTIASWCEKSSFIYDHAAAGDVTGACELLRRQIGVVSYKPFMNIIRNCYVSVQSASIGYPSMPAISAPLLRGEENLPACVYTMKQATQFFKMAMRYFQAGNFDECQNLLHSLLLMIPFVIVTDRKDEATLKGYINDIREYLITLMLEKKRKECQDPHQSLLYAYYQTRCHLQGSHTLLILNSVMVHAFKSGNYIDCASIANRILANPEINSPANAALLVKTKKVLARCEKEGRNAYESCLLDNRPFVLDVLSMEPLFSETKRVQCPYCHAEYDSNHKDQMCGVCKVAKIGLETLGLVCYKP